jgi:CheY-like chemotaxis protein
VDALALVDLGLQFDLALLDMSSDGECISFAEEVRARRMEIPLAAMDFLRPRGPLFDSFLAKPIRQSHLIELLDAAFCQDIAPGAIRDFREDIPSGPLRVLVAEDDPVNCKVALLMLGRLGCIADTARNGDEVLALLEGQRYDLIFMDVQMPDMDGLEATRRILKLWPGSRPRIVAMTACALKGDRERCLQAGMDDYIAKPISIGDLRDAMGRCMGIRQKNDA